MLIRSEQMTMFQTEAEEGFVRRLSAHLLEHYAKSLVRTPDIEAAVEELSEETLHSLIRSSIDRARSYDISFESSIAAFSAVMFEVAPNFDKHRLSEVLLNDEEVDPNNRLDALLEVFTEKNWDSVRESYDINAWQPAAEENTE